MREGRGRPAGAPWGIVKRLLSWGLALLALGGSVYLAARRGLDWGVVGRIEITDVVLLAALNVGAMGVNATVNRMLVRALGADMSFREAFALSAAGAWLNTILPFQGGAAGRGIYLKRRHNLAYSHFAAVQAAAYTLVFLIGSAAGVCLWLILRMSGMEISPALLYLCLGLTAGMLLLLVVPFPRLTAHNRIVRILVSAMEGWQVLKHPGLVIKVGALLAANYLLMAAQLGLAFGALGHDVEVPSVLFVAVLVSLSQVVRITPGNLGIREAVTGAMAEVVRSGFGVGVLASGLIRIVALVVVTAVGPFCSYWLGGKATREAPTCDPRETIGAPK